MASKHISLPLTFAVGDPTEGFKRFEICCRANEWSDAVKVLKLPTLLFLTGLPTHVSRQLWAAGEIDDLDKVLGWAKLLLTIEKQGKTTVVIDNNTSRSRGIEGADVSTHRVSSSIGYTAYSYPISRGTSVLSLPPARAFAAELSRSKAVFLVWPVWTPDKGLPVRKRQRDVPHGPRAFRKAIGPPGVVSVATAAVRSSAAVLRGIIGNREVEMMLDSGSTVSLIQERIATSLPAVKQRRP